MNHVIAADLLAAYALGACDADEEADVEAHVAKCPTCAAELATLSEAVRLLGGAQPGSEL